MTSNSTAKDSIIANHFAKDFFFRDTIDFVKFREKIIVDDAVIVKNMRSKILGNLVTKGSIIRGITFGNNQGQSVQSSMDLQISGRLSENVSILASISDHNFPMQADGYTQTLEEFDKIFIELAIKNRSILRAGYLDNDDQTSYFSRYQRRTVGLSFATQFGEKNKTSTFLTAGIARSEFHRINFQGIEGNLGPYRLTGKDGEQFITIISGSEQVFIDGVLMKRGEDGDYVINYNTGELTFTAARPIYKQYRIAVSYNYTNRNYNRFLVTGAVQHESEKLKLGLSWFSENDNKNAPLSLNLSKEDEQALVDAGNDQALMFAPSAKKAEYDVNKILYQKVRNGDYFEYSTDASQTLYQVTFTYFGTNRGDYRLKNTVNNGRIFEYAGKNLGEYLPVRKLPAPEKNQVISTSTVYNFGKGQAGADFSVSNHDQNLFSSINNKNTGYAARIFGRGTLKKALWTGSPSFEYRHINRKFHILDRINEINFNKDFNLAQEFSGRNQDRLMLSFLNLWQNKNFINYKFNYLSEENFYKGIKNEADFGFSNDRYSATGNLSYLSTKGSFQNTQFTRAALLAERKGSKGSWATGGSMEHNVKRFTDTGLFDTTGYSWREIFFQRKIGDSARTLLLSRVYIRDNDSVRNNRLESSNRVFGVSAEADLIKNERTQLSAIAHYRKFFYKNQLPQMSQHEDFLTGNFLYRQQFFKNGMRLQGFYELGKGREAQREFQYLKVTDGQGIYKWTDYNGNGTQQLDEFEIAEYSDLAQYIRIYTNTVNYVPSNNNKLQLSLFVNPATILSSENAFLKRWNFDVSVLAQNSFYKNNRAVVWAPFHNEKDQILKNQNLLLSARFSPTDKSGWNMNYRFTASDNVLNANFSREETSQKLHFLNLGYLISRDFRVDVENSQQNIINDSQLFKARNYHLKNWEAKPKATYKITASTQAELGGALRLKLRTDGEERLKTLEISGSLQWELRKTSLRGNFSFIDNNFTGNSFSIVGNRMLEGLKGGKNEVWSIFLQQNLNSFIILNLNYEGRNSGERTIHTGSVQVKASF